MKVILRSSDGDHFEVGEAVAVQSKRIKKVMEHSKDMEIVAVDVKVPTTMLIQVIEYCLFQIDLKENPRSPFEMEKWECEYLKRVHRGGKPYDKLIDVATYMEVEDLLDFLYQAVVDFDCLYPCDMVFSHFTEEQMDPDNIINFMRSLDFHMTPDFKFPGM